MGGEELRGECAGGTRVQANFRGGISLGGAGQEAGSCRCCAAVAATFAQRLPRRLQPTTVGANASVALFCFHPSSDAPPTVTSADVTRGGRKDTRSESELGAAFATEEPGSGTTKPVGAEAAMAAWRSVHKSRGGISATTARCFIYRMAAAGAGDLSPSWSLPQPVRAVSGLRGRHPVLQGTWAHPGTP